MGLPFFQSLSARLHPAGGPFAPEPDKPLPRSMLIKASLILLISMLAGIATAAEQARRNGTDNPLLHPPAIHLQLSHGNTNTKSVPDNGAVPDNATDVSSTTPTDESPSQSEVEASLAAAAAVSPVLNTLAGTPTTPNHSVVTTTSSQTPPPADTAPTPAPAPQPEPAPANQPPADTQPSTPPPNDPPPPPRGGAGAGNNTPPPSNPATP